MTLSTFHPYLLKLMHFLVQKQKFMNSVEIAKDFSIGEKKFTDRNIRNWFGFLRKKDFWYYPHPKLESFGLTHVFMIVKGLSTDNIFSCIPYLTYIMHGSDIRTFDNCIVATYFISPNEFKNFKKFWDLAKEKKLVSDFKIFPTRTPLTLFAPLHKIVSRDGKFDFSSITDEDLDYFMEMLNSKILENSKIEVHNAIVSNPLIVPIAKEYFKTHPSSKKAWLSMKQKFGETAWDYIRLPKHKRKDGIAMKRIQRTVKHLHENFSEFFSQIRIDYIPFYREDTIALYLFVNLKNKDSISEFTKNLLKNSHHTIVYFPLNKKSNTHIFFVVTNAVGMGNILYRVMPSYIDKKADNTIFWRDFEKSYSEWNKYEQVDKFFLKEKYWNLFDPKKASWTYSHKEYMNKLNSLHKLQEQ